MVLYNSKTDETKLYTASEKGIQSPHFGKNADQIFLAANPRLNSDPTNSDANTGTFVSHLYKCNITNDSCDRQFDFPGNIRASAELSDGNILFSGGTPSNMADPFAPKAVFVGYRDFEFYLFDQRTKATEKLTGINAIVLAPISVAGRRVAFQMDSRFRRFKSEIYLATLNSDNQFEDLVEAITEPFISYGTKPNLRPSLSPDGRHLVFEAATSRSETRGYVYVFVIADVQTKSVVEVFAPMETGNANNLSMPVFIDDTTIRYIQLERGEYSLWQYSLQSGEPELIKRLKISDIALIERINISR
ncbi:hypothetical protein GCM10007094_18380 [Pseudovibrio japonicus]|uniref:Uncharacterized protein n=2 Tax=Pseudovibrio japonicus TaxID=366534 RepID=A0ABQ3ECE5_9HYPH|nr:hypothetical protein GCM10007094_18380 [Pseudovibrio japonicus]